MVKLAKQVELRDLQFGNVGSAFWTNVKFDPQFVASWSTVKNAPLWKEDQRFKTSVWSWLCDGTPDWTVTTVTKVMAAEGALHKVKMETGGKEEYIHWGEVGVLLKARPLVDAVVVEVMEGPNTISEDVIAAIAKGAQRDSGVRVVVLGPLTVMQQQLESGPLSKLLEGHAALGGYKKRVVHIYHSKDDFMGAKLPGYHTFMRMAVLLSPGNIKPGPGFIVSHVGWSAVVYSHLLGLLDLHSDTCTSGRV